MKNIIVYMGHPAHFHLFRNVIHNLLQDRHRVRVLIKTKDILESLIAEQGFDYKNILPEGRKDNKFSMFCGMLKRDVALYKECTRERPDLLVGTSVENSHISKLLSIPCINVNEDDAAAAPLYAKLSYPWANTILTPDSCDSGKWDNKALKYSGYHELAYLHPHHFSPSKEIVARYFDPSKSFFLVRFAKLSAHHDAGIQGLSREIASTVIELLQPHGDIYITSERELEPEFEPYRLSIDPLDIHHVMSFAKAYIGDSQTMAAEAAVLGTPFVRFNDFVGRIGYLDELENRYKLGFGLKTNEVDRLYEVVREIAANSGLRKENQKRRQKMLADKIDVARFLTWFVESYPDSERIMKEEPEYQERFK